jgi:hypothetical protein
MKKQFFCQLLKVKRRKDEKSGETQPNRKILVMAEACTQQKTLNNR